MCSQQVVVNGKTRILYVAPERCVHVCTSDRDVAGVMRRFCQKYPKKGEYVAKTNDGIFFEMPVKMLVFCRNNGRLNVKTEFSEERESECRG